MVTRCDCSRRNDEAQVHRATRVMVYLSLAQQAVPARQAAKQASANISKQLDDSDSDNAPANKVINKYGKKAARRKRALKSSGESEELRLGNLGNPPRGGHAPQSSPDKRIGLGKKPQLALDVAGNRSSESELTPITPSEYSGKSHTPPASSSNHSSQPLRPFPLLTGTDNGNSNGGNKRKRPEPRSRPKPWMNKALGDYVWVLIDNHSRVFNHEDKAALDKEYIWWPAKISRLSPGKGVHVTVVLYGQAPSKVENVKVGYPAEDNILPFENLAGMAQFQDPSYVTPSHHELLDVLTSPRKKAKRDRNALEQRWHIAVLELNAERESSQGNQTGPSFIRCAGADGGIRPPSTRASDEESLPDVGEGIWKASLTSIPTGTNNGHDAKSKRKDSLPGHTRRRRRHRPKAVPLLKEEEDDDCIKQLQAGVWNPSDEAIWPLTDDMLQIPGELIFAMGKGTDRNHWPARVLEYIPPRNPREKEGRYRIEYLDRTTKILKRSSFFTSEEDGFATCKLGQFESSYDEVGNDSETEEPPEHHSRSRAASPVSSYPPPSKEDFCELDIRTQFVYTKPILTAILNERYPPARERHDKFLKGGAARKSAVDSASFRGELDPRSVTELHKWLYRWCLRDETDNPGPTDSIQVQQSEHVADRTGIPHANQDGVKDQHTLQKEEADENQAHKDQGDSTTSSDSTPDLQGSQMDGASRSFATPAVNDIAGVVECWDQLPSSMDIVSSPRQLPDSDVSMVNMESVDYDSPLSPLSESTPTPVEGPEVNLHLMKGDTNSPLRDLTEGEQAVQLTLPASNINNEGETTLLLPRQHGCPAFEALRMVEKLDYCLNVLLPEAIIQLLLWRKGLRNTVELLPPEEEQRLHDEGIKLLQVTDWVFDVIRLRRARERYIDKKNNGALASSQTSERGGGRLRNVGRVSYVE